MYLRNPVFRALLRSVIAALFDEAQKAYRLIFSKFGKDAEKASEFIWKNKEVEPYKSIGHERIDRTHVNNVVELLGDDLGGGRKELPTVATILKYIRDEQTGHVTDDDPRYIRKFTSSIENKLLRKYQSNQFPANKLFEILNIAAIEQDLQEILSNPEMYNRVMGELKYKAPGSPYEKLSSDYRETLPMRLRVALSYIDSFEN